MAPSAIASRRGRGRRPTGIGNRPCQASEESPASPVSKRRKQQNVSTLTRQLTPQSRRPPSLPVERPRPHARRPLRQQHSVATPPPPGRAQSRLQPVDTDTCEDVDVGIVKQRTLSQIFPEGSEHHVESDAAGFENGLEKHPLPGVDDSVIPNEPIFTGQDDVPGNTEEVFGENDDLRGDDRHDDQVASNLARTRMVSAISHFSDLRTLLTQHYSSFETLLRTGLMAVEDKLSQRFNIIEAEMRQVTLHVDELRVVANTRTSNGMKKKTPLSIFEEKLEIMTPHAKWVFDDEALSRIEQGYIPFFFMTCWKDQVNVISKVSEGIRALLFSVMPKETRLSYSSVIGAMHSRLRHGLVLNAILNAQQKRLGKFREDNIGIPVENGSPCTPRSDGVLEKRSGNNTSTNGAVRSCSDGDRITQPKWLRQGIILREDVEAARARTETSATTADAGEIDDIGAENNGKAKQKWLIVKDHPSERDAAIFGALKVYRIVTAALYYGREACRTSFFEELGYTMVDWSVLNGSVDQHDLCIEWASIDAECEDDDLESVALTTALGSDPTAARKNNMKLYSELLAQRMDMVVLVSHPVQMKTGSSGGRRFQGQIRKLRRSISLLDVAAKFLISFTEQGQTASSPDNLLGAHSESLRCLFGVACVLREIVAQFLDEHTDGGKLTSSRYGIGSRIQFQGLKLESLMPSASVQGRVLRNRCLKMSEESFEVLDVGGLGLESRVGASNKSLPLARQILPSFEDGVVLL